MTLIFIFLLSLLINSIIHTLTLTSESFFYNSKVSTEIKQNNRYVFCWFEDPFLIFIVVALIVFYCVHINWFIKYRWATIMYARTDTNCNYCNWRNSIRRVRSYISTGTRHLFFPFNPFISNRTNQMESSTFVYNNFKLAKYSVGSLYFILAKSCHNTVISVLHVW